MADDAASGRDGKGRFAQGNPGRPHGLRSRVTRAVEEMLDGDAEKLTRKAIDLALGGDLVALKLCLDRIAPPRKDAPLSFDMPAVRGAEDHPGALAAVVQAMAEGALTPTEAQAFASILAEHRKAIETSELAERMIRVEERLSLGAGERMQ